MPEKPHISWVVKPPKYSCVNTKIQGKGLCMLRHKPDSRMSCETEYKEYCKYRVSEDKPSDQV